MTRAEPANSGKRDRIELRGIAREEEHPDGLAVAVDEAPDLARGVPVERPEVLLASCTAEEVTTSGLPSNVIAIYVPVRPMRRQRRIG